MDPITILQTVSAALEIAVFCGKTCQKLYEFTHDVRTIGKTLARIEDEVADLERILGLVKGVLLDPHVRRTERTETGREMLKAVHGSIERSRYLLTKLEGILKIIEGGSSGQSTIVALRQAVRSYKKSKELTECITLADKSKSSLNVCLHVLVVFMVANSPAYRRAGNETEIAPFTKELEISLAKTKRSKDDFHLRRAATTVLDKARSPNFEERLSRSSTLQATPGNEEHSDVSDDDETPGLEQPVARWMLLLQSAKATRRGSLAGHVRDATSAESLDANDTDPSELVEPPSELWQIRSVRKFVEMGNKNYASGNRQQALAELEQAMLDAVGLSELGRTFIHRELIHVRLTIADLQTTSTEPDLNVAEEHLLQAILAVNEDRRSSDLDMQQAMYRAFYLLAKVYYMEQNYQDAEVDCVEALNVRMRLGDESSQLYWQARQLLVLIHHGQGNSVKFRPELDEMPGDWRIETNRMIIASTTNGGPNPPRPIERMMRAGRRPSDVRHVHATSEAMIQSASQNSQSVGPGTPLTDTGEFEDKLDPARGQSVGSQDPVSILAEAGFKGDFDAQKALNWAVVKGDSHIIHSLLHAPGIKVMKSRRLGSPVPVLKLASLEGNKKELAPLIVALSTPGRIMIAKKLLDHGAPKSSVDEAKRSLLEIAAMNGDPEAVSILVGHGITIHSTEGTHAFVLAGQCGHLKVLQLFIEDLGMKVDDRAAYGRTALFWAAWRGHDACLKFLLHKGADMNIADNGGSTPLMAAAREKHESTVALLLRYFAKVSFINGRRQTALIIAAELSQVAIARMLLEASDGDGTKVDQRDSHGWTALIWACSNKDMQMAKLLLEFNANVNTQCNKGSKALDHVKGRPGLTNLLKQYNATTGSGVSRRGICDEPFKGYVLI